MKVLNEYKNDAGKIVQVIQSDPQTIIHQVTDEEREPLTFKQPEKVEDAKPYERDGKIYQLHQTDEHTIVEKCLGEAPSPSPDSTDSEDSGRCQAKTAAGSQCKRAALEDKTVCSVHDK